MSVRTVPHIGQRSGQPPLAATSHAPSHRMRAFVGASQTHQDLEGWTPASYAAASLPGGDRAMLARRIHDLARNDGWSSAGLTKLVDNIIGAGWRLNARPSARALGISEDAAVDLAAEIEEAFEEWANDSECWCDAAQRSSFGGLLALAYRHRALDGEALAVINSLRDRPNWWTAIEIIDPDRLANPAGQVSSDTLRDGVALGRHGEPTGYWIRVKHPADQAAVNQLASVRVPRSQAGLRLVVHAFEADRAGQVRGVSALATVVKKLRMLSRYDEAELQAATLNSVLAAFVTSPFDHAALAESMAGGPPSPDTGTDGYLDSFQASREAYWKENAPSLPTGMRLNFLHPSEDIKLTAPGHPNANFDKFVAASLRNIASAIGITYEQLSADWSQVNYSSARAALLEVWRGFTARGGHFAHQFVQPIYVRVLEEAIARGKVRVPRGCVPFAKARYAWSRARWLMPGRGWVDPVKEANAAVLRMGNGLSTLEREAAEQGLDWEEVLTQRAREQKRAAQLEAQFDLQPGSLLPGAQTPSGAAGTPDPVDQDQDDDKTMKEKRS